MEMMRYFWDAAVALDSTAFLTKAVASRFASRPPLGELFKEAGLQQVEVRPIDIRTAFRGFDDYGNDVRRP